MKYTTLENRLVESITRSIKDVTPGVVVRAYQSGKLIVDISVGQTYPYYDLASLTKIIFTVQAMMQAYDKGFWDLQQSVQSHLPWFPHREISNKEILIKDLLTHTSGLPWWLPLYKEISNEVPISKRWDVVQQQIIRASFENTGKSVYSDVGFWVLKFLLEKF